jgi:hypothetical protein
MQFFCSDAQIDIVSLIGCPLYVNAPAAMGEDDSTAMNTNEKADVVIQKQDNAKYLMFKERYEDPYKASRPSFTPKKAARRTMNGVFKRQLWSIRKQQREGGWKKEEVLKRQDFPMKFVGESTFTDADKVRFMRSITRQGANLICIRECTLTYELHQEVLPLQHLFFLPSTFTLLLSYRP